VGRLLPRQRESIFELLSGIVREDQEHVARVLFDMGRRVPGVVYDYAKFEADVVEIMEHHLCRKTWRHIQLQDFFSDLLAGAIRHKIRLPSCYTMVFKALVTLEGISKQIAPNLDLLAAAQPYLSDVMLERCTPRALLEQAADGLGHVSRMTRNLAQVAPQLLHDIEQGRLRIQMELPQMEILQNDMRRHAQRTSRAIIGSSLLLGGLAALAIPNLAMWAGAPLLSWGLWSTAIILLWPIITNR
jgi:ubiquinone biosynthesis protein